VSVEIVVPWRAGCPHRERAWELVRGRYAEIAYPVVEAPGPDPWNKALAVMPALERSTADIVVVADADVWCDGLVRAVQAVEDGAPWAIPYLLVHRLDAERKPEQRPYAGMAGGGIVVAPRETLLDVPLDPRFVGWGQEDQCWGWALHALAGPPWRGDADLVHYYHPPQKRLNRKRGSNESWALRRRYLAARRDPAAMRALLEESRVPSNAAQ